MLLVFYDSFNFMILQVEELSKNVASFILFFFIYSCFES